MNAETAFYKSTIYKLGKQLSKVNYIVNFKSFDHNINKNWWKAGWIGDLK